MWDVVKVRFHLEPVGREDFAGVVYKGKYYVHGGNNPYVEGSALRDTWVLNLTNLKWSQLKDGPVTRHCHGMWAGNNKLYVLGGRTDLSKEGDFSIMNVRHSLYFAYYRLAQALKILFAPCSGL
jgi:hypothetical protein